MYDIATDIKNKVICGNSVDILSQFPQNSIDLVVTSPPYYLQRNYKHKNQIGTETTPQDYIKNLIDIFRECKRVLKNSGSIWVNIADSYNNLKSLIGIPERFVIAMQDELGLIRRNSIIWFKPSCMPSSVKDRFTIDFEYFYFFVKSNKTELWHNEVTKEWINHAPPLVTGKEGIDWEWFESNGEKLKRSLWRAFDYYFETQYEPMVTDMSKEYKGKAIKDYAANGVQNPSDIKKRMIESYNKKIKFGGNKFPDEVGKTYSGNVWVPNANLERIKRTVWAINTGNSKENHFASYPEKLIETPIKACCPKGGIVLDPFAGSGTTLLKARKMERSYCGIELNSDYVNIINKRLGNMIEVYLK